MNIIGMLFWGVFCTAAIIAFFEIGERSMSHFIFFVFVELALLGIGVFARLVLPVRTKA